MIDSIRQYAYFNKKHGLLTKKLGETLQEMKRDGTMKKIYEQHDFKD